MHGTGPPALESPVSVKADRSTGLLSRGPHILAGSLQGWQLGDEAKRGTATWGGACPLLALGQGHACELTPALWFLPTPPCLHSITPQLLALDLHTCKRNLSMLPSPHQPEPLCFSQSCVPCSVEEQGGSQRAGFSSCLCHPKCLLFRNPTLRTLPPHLQVVVTPPSSSSPSPHAITPCETPCGKGIVLVLGFQTITEL